MKYQKKKLQDKSPRVGYVFDSRPSANMWYDQAWLKIVSPKTGHSNTKHLASPFWVAIGAMLKSRNYLSLHN